MYNQTGFFEAMDVAQWVLIGAAIVIVLAVLIISVNYALYKKRINKVLESGEPAKTPMPTPRSTAAVIGLIIWIGTTVFMLVQLQTLNYYSFMMKNTTDIMVQQVDSIYGVSSQSIWDKVNEQNNAQVIAANYIIKLGKVHDDTKTIDLTLTVTPNVIPGKDDVLTFRIGDSKTVMKKIDNGKYSGTVQTSVFHEQPAGILTLESDGEKINQIINDTLRYPLDEGIEQNEVVDEDTWCKCFPLADFSERDTQVKTNGDKTNITSVITTERKGSMADSSNKFTEMTLVFENAGKEIKRVDLMKDSSVQVSGDSYTYTFNGTVSKNNDAVIYYLLAKDKDGYSYKLYRPGEYIIGWKSGKIGAVTDTDEHSIIYNKDGSILKTTEYFYSE